MTDAPQQRRQGDSQTSITTTASIGLGLAGGGDIVLYIFHCIQEGELTVPSTETCLTIAAMLAPFIHIVGRGVMNRLNRWADKGQPA